MDIIDWLLLSPLKQDYLASAIMLFGEDEVYAAICMGILIVDEIRVKINIH